jgi:hypothetical protein
VHRHEGLQPLSREHHFALLYAKRLQAYREASPEWLRERRAQLQRCLSGFWDGALANHFIIEEQHLPWARLSPDWASRLWEDHARIAALWQAARKEPTDAEALAQLGSELSAHARWEERELFPAVEAATPQPELRALVERFGELPSADPAWLPPPLERR